jgi:hypothetical protein
MTAIAFVKIRCQIQGRGSCDGNQSRAQGLESSADANHASREYIRNVVTGKF